MIQAAEAKYDEDLYAFNSTLLNVAVPVSGANCDVRVDVKNLTTNENLTGECPVMLSITKLVGEQMSVPLFAPTVNIPMTNKKRPGTFKEYVGVRRSR